MKQAIITITGPSLSGKTTFSFMLEKVGNFRVLVSHTTRSPRNGEVYGRDYYFVMDAEFDQIEFVETVEFNGYRYGMSAEEVKNTLDAGYIPVIVVEPNGAREIEAFCKKQDIRCFKVFMNTPLEVRMERFIERVRKDGPEKLASHFSRLEHTISEESKWANDPSIRWDLIVGTYGERGHSLRVATYLIAQYLEAILADQDTVGLVLSAASADEDARRSERYSRL